MTHARLHAIGLGIVAGTLGGMAFAVIGALVGPSGLIGSLLLTGGGFIGAAQLLKWRKQRGAPTGQAGAELIFGKDSA